MKYCQQCGKACDDVAAYCGGCGASLNNEGLRVDSNLAQSNSQSAHEQSTTQHINVTICEPEPEQMSETDKTLRLIAFVFNLICTIAFGCLLIPLAWMIPMTVMSWNIYKGKRRNTVAFGVCNVLFLSLVSGILLLCSKKA